eukprot:GHRR01019972.1.p2 GENE.GHRR01019972.1~~GHRR01019972.1.p2  ORF type:complete len:112 (+),score=19.51 GHRR01019972.1:1109-1444(+)
MPYRTARDRPVKLQQCVVHGFRSNISCKLTRQVSTLTAGAIISNAKQVAQHEPEAALQPSNTRLSVIYLTPAQKQPNHLSTSSKLFTDVALGSAVLMAITFQSSSPSSIMA